jgi:hypothetical protein
MWCKEHRKPFERYNAAVLLEVTKSMINLVLVKQTSSPLEAADEVMALLERVSPLCCYLEAIRADQMFSLRQVTLAKLRGTLYLSKQQEIYYAIQVIERRKQRDGAQGRQVASQEDLYWANGALKGSKVLSGTSD